MFPASSHFAKSLFVYRPVVKRRWVEIRTVRPDQRVYFRIDRHAIEEIHVPERPIKFARKDRKKIDGLFRAVVKSYAERMRRDDLDPFDLTDPIRGCSVAQTGTTDAPGFAMKPITAKS